VVSDVWQLERVDIEPPRMCRMELRVVVCIMVLEAVSIKRIVTVNNLESVALAHFLPSSASAVASQFHL
jgi:hypothetical protein